jgi:hypothetical protein
MPAGTGKTRPASATTYSCHVPLTLTVTTRCPTVRPSVPLSNSSITPTDSIPGTVGNSGVNPYLPRMVCRSLACTGTDATRMRTSPGPGSGIGRACRCRTSKGSPIVSARTDRMVRIFTDVPSVGPGSHSGLVVHSVGRAIYGDASDRRGGIKALLALMLLPRWGCGLEPRRSSAPTPGLSRSVGRSVELASAAAHRPSAPTSLGRQNDPDDRMISLPSLGVSRSTLTERIAEARPRARIAFQHSSIGTDRDGFRRA